MSRPAPVLIRSLTDARSALTAATLLESPVSLVTLVSAPSAAAYLGVGWFLGLISVVTAGYPRVPMRAVLDCGDLPGTVLGAVRAGAPYLRFTGRANVAQRLSSLAASVGIVVFNAETLAPPFLDLAEIPPQDQVARCKLWFLTSPPDVSSSRMGLMPL